MDRKSNYFGGEMPNNVSGSEFGVDYGTEFSLFDEDDFIVYDSRAEQDDADGTMSTDVDDPDGEVIMVDSEDLSMQSDKFDYMSTNAGASLQPRVTKQPARKAEPAKGVNNPATDAESGSDKTKCEARPQVTGESVPEEIRKLRIANEYFEKRALHYRRLRQLTAAKCEQLDKTIQEMERNKHDKDPLSN